MAGPRSGTGRQRPAAGHRPSADGARAGRPASRGRWRPDARRHRPGDGPPGPSATPGVVRRRRGDRPGVLDGPVGPLSDEPAPRARPGGGGHSFAADEGAEAAHPGLQPRPIRPRTPPTRAAAGVRPYRFRQDHHRRGDRGRVEREPGPPHRHHRGPGGVRARARTQRGGAGGDWRGRAELSRGAPIGVAAGARRDRDRRDARHRIDPHRGHRRRDRAPDHRHRACARRGRRGVPRGRRLSVGTTEHGAAGAGDGVGRDPLAEPVAWQPRGPGAGRRATGPQLRRAPAHPEEHAAEPAPGDDQHAQAGFVHARGIAGRARARGADRSRDGFAASRAPRRAGPAPGGTRRPSRA